MNIGQAVNALKDDKFVRRSGWSEKNMHLYLENLENLEDQLSRAIGDGVFSGHFREYAPVVVLYNSKGIHQPGWVCSQEDLLATDWEVCS
jgi:hypothetical protein